MPNEQGTQDQHTDGLGLPASAKAAPRGPFSDVTHQDLIEARVQHEARFLARIFGAGATDGAERVTPPGAPRRLFEDLQHMPLVSFGQGAYAQDYFG